MVWIKSLIIAFATYSRLPVPNVDWNEKNMKYSICYFPLISVPIIVFQVLIWYLCRMLNLSDILKSALMTTLPILITGGIHLDGFCDTSDALNSYQSREKRLEILKDSHIGAFALIKTIIYMILYFGLVSNLKSLKSVLIYGIIFCIERSLSGLSVVNFKNARGDGMLHSFSSVAEKNIVNISMIFYIIVSFVFMGLLNIKSCVVNLVLSVIVFAYYKRMSYKIFGGTTGDLAGYFLQICELVLLIGTVLTNI